MYRKTFVFALALWAVGLGCAGTRRPEVHLLSKLVPDRGLRVEACAVDSAGAWLCQESGFVLRVRHADDETLNRRFAEVSYRGAESANPFTYGNWVDPELGYVPPRFTVFRVSLANREAEGVRPLLEGAYLRTDRGDSLASLSVSDLVNRYNREWPNDKSLVATARTLAERNLLTDESIRPGEERKGYVVFSYLDPAVYRVELHFAVEVLNQGRIDTAIVKLPFKQKLERLDYPGAGRKR